MKPKSLSEVKSQDKFLEYLIDNYYHVLGEDDKFDKFVSWSDVLKTHVLTVTPTSKFITLEEFDGNIGTYWMTTLSAYKDKIGALRNKPSFEDHPDAKCFVQNNKGYWWKNVKTSRVITSEQEHSPTGWAVIDNADCGGWFFVQPGQVIGDWKQSFEKTPEKKGTAVCKKDAIIEQLVAKGIHNYLDSLVKDALVATRDRQQQKYIKELEQENQELKTKLDHIKQMLY